MSYGLVGAHRTGKTTLAKRFSEVSMIPFVQTSTSAIMQRNGFDPRLDYPLADRIHMQEIILDELDLLYRESPRVFITDRTPIDAAAYMLADVTRTDTMLDVRIMKYVERCLSVTNEHFSMLLVVQPGIPLKEEEGKAPANPAYIEHIAQLVMGLVNDERLGSRHFFIPKRFTRLEDREACLIYSIRRAKEKAGLEVEDFVGSGGKLQ
jgi:hypothetical protein